MSESMSICLQIILPTNKFGLTPLTSTYGWFHDDVQQLAHQQEAAQKSRGFQVQYENLRLEVKGQGRLGPWGDKIGLFADVHVGTFEQLG